MFSLLIEKAFTSQPGNVVDSLGGNSRDLVKLSLLANMLRSEASIKSLVWLYVQPRSGGAVHAYGQ